MKYTDLIAHLNKIQEAMWKTISGNVSVFIGAGFSRNSNPIDDGSNKFPDWSQLSLAMIEDLYPLDCISIDERNKYINKAEVPAQILRFAQEYKELFGQVQLDNLLKKNIPDDKYEPNELYLRLLELQWKDIFTTNYDTLLERATEKVFERDYLIITKIQDLAASYSPRIIKLHGSFPNNTPFIITEEEFRTYSDNYKPFVNTVRQSLIENIFVLIGFSGDDPNFLSWIGWIRDNMQNYTQKIYICTLGTFTEYTEAQKRLLNNRNIEILDLALIFEEESTGLKGVDPNYHDALKWLFDYLKKGRKVNPKDWPTVKAPLIPPYIPIDALDRDEREIIQNKEIASKVDEYLRIIKETYPGWIITPEKIRNILSHNLINFNLKDIINGCDNDIMTIRILVNYIWLYRLKYDSLDYYQVEIIHAYIENLKDDKVRWFGIINDKLVLKNFIELIFYMISDAREIKDTKSLAYYFEILDNQKITDPYFIQLYNYEKTMNILYEMNIQKIINQIQLWDVDIKFPIYSLMKASILCEVNRLQEAREIVSNVMESLRKSRKKTIKDKSIEGISLYILGMLEEYKTSAINSDSDHENYWERLEKIDIELCNPISEISRITLNVGKENRKKKPVVEKIKSFEPFRYKTIRHFNTGSQNNFNRRIINLFDYTPIPMRCGNYVTITQDIVLEVVKSFQYEQPLYAIPFLMRYKSNDIIKDAITRFYVGVLDQKSFDYIFYTYYHSLIENINYINENKYDSSSSSIIISQIELLSCLILRTTKEQFDLIVKLINKVYSSTKIVRDWRITENKTKLVDRALEHISLVHTNELINLEYFLDMPVPDEDVLIDQRYEYSQPWNKFYDKSLSSFNNLSISNETIRKLLNYASNSNEAIRSYAISRLNFYYKIEKLNEGQIEEFKERLWSFTDKNELPEYTGLRTWVFLDMPQPENVDVSKLVKQYLSNIDFKKHMLISTSISSRGNELVDKISNIFDSTLNVLRFKKKHNYMFFNNEELRVFLCNILVAWKSIKDEIENSIKKADSDFRNELKGNYQLIADFLSIIVLPNLTNTTDEDKSELYGMAKALEKFDIYIPQLLVYLINQNFSITDLENNFCNALLSNDEEEVEAFVRALTFWSLLGNNFDNVQKVPEKLTDELVDIIKNIRRTAFIKVLERINYVIIQIPSLFNSEQYKVIINSLNELERITELPNINQIVNNEFKISLCQKEELPDYRARVSEVTSTIFRNMQSNKIIVDDLSNKIVFKLKEKYINDVFPEVIRPWIDENE